MKRAYGHHGAALVTIEPTTKESEAGQQPAQVSSRHRSAAKEDSISKSEAQPVERWMTRGRDLTTLPLPRSVNKGPMQKLTSILQVEVGVAGVLYSSNCR